MRRRRVQSEAEPQRENWAIIAFTVMTSVVIVSVFWWAH